jgi:hypothetical protein
MLVPWGTDLPQTHVRVRSCDAENPDVERDAGKGGGGRRNVPKNVLGDRLEVLRQ